MAPRPALFIATGAFATAALAGAFAEATDTPLAQRMAGDAARAIAEAGGRGVRASFVAAEGSPTRHPLLSGGERLDEATRAAVAQAVAEVPGVGGVNWVDGTVRAEAGELAISPLHCQDDVQALLRARTIRFEESSSRIDAASADLLDEVAAALRPCLGSIIAVTGHTDSSGPEPGNLELSQERADAVERALVARGIPSDGLRARGVGSAHPAPGLDPGDPANRRIEFSVLATKPLKPTPIDTPGPR
jgi:OOP family OmpA-OmpF porin